MLIRFQPIYQERVWGGRELATRFGRTLPPDGQPYGESWELVDRPEAQSMVLGGPHEGRSLHELWTGFKQEIFGENAPVSERFPLLLKILDAQDVLSLQVHPPVEKAAALGGEPKTEMWVIAHAAPGAKLFAGVRQGTTRESFAAAIANATVEQLVPSLAAAQGDFIFIPSGRLHAIGAGLLIFEIQQNSDTTYRVYDWGRKGLDGQPRALHVEKSLESIDFSDTEPGMGKIEEDNVLVSCEHFHVSQHQLAADESLIISTEEAAKIMIVVAGSGLLGNETLSAGDHLLLSVAPRSAQVKVAAGGLWVLLVEFGVAAE